MNFKILTLGLILLVTKSVLSQESFQRKIISTNQEDYLTSSGYEQITDSMGIGFFSSENMFDMNKSNLFVSNNYGRIEKVKMLTDKDGNPLDFSVFEVKAKNKDSILVCINNYNYPTYGYLTTPCNIINGKTIETNTFIAYQKLAVNKNSIGLVGWDGTWGNIGVLNTDLSSRFFKKLTSNSKTSINHIICNSNNSYAFTGAIQIDNNRSKTVVGVFDENGTLTWTYMYGNANKSDGGKKLIKLNDGSFVVLSESTELSSSEAYLTLTNITSTGIINWSKRLGNPDFTFIKEGNINLNLGDDGNIYITCNTNTYGFGSNDNLIVKTSPQGKLLSAWMVGTNGGDYNAFTATSNESLYYLSTTYDGLVFGKALLDGTGINQMEISISNYDEVYDNVEIPSITLVDNTVKGETNETIYLQDNEAINSRTIEESLSSSSFVKVVESTNGYYHQSACINGNITLLNWDNATSSMLCLDRYGVKLWDKSYEIPIKGNNVRIFNSNRSLFNIKTDDKTIYRFDGNRQDYVFLFSTPKIRYSNLEVFSYGGYDELNIAEIYDSTSSKNGLYYCKMFSWYKALMFDTKMISRKMVRINKQGNIVLLYQFYNENTIQMLTLKESDGSVIDSVSFNLSGLLYNSWLYHPLLNGEYYIGLNNTQNTATLIRFDRNNNIIESQLVTSLYLQSILSLANGDIVLCGKNNSLWAPVSVCLNPQGLFKYGSLFF